MIMTNTHNGDGLDLACLRSFVSVVQLGQFTLAAKEIGITQPGVTRHVQKLERAFGIPLIERLGGGIILTESGREVFSYAEKALMNFDRLLVEVNNANGVLFGDLRIAASSTPGEFLVPNWINQFSLLHPGVRPHVFIADSQDVLEELREGRWDLGFVGVRPHGRALQALQYDIVSEDSVILAVPFGHPFAKRKEVRLAELEGQPFVEREGGSGTQLSVRSALDHRKLRLPNYRVAMVLSTTQAVVSAVQSGYGLGLVSSLALESRDPNRVVRVRVKELPSRRQIFLVRERGRALPPLVKSFATWVLSLSRKRLSGY